MFTKVSINPASKGIEGNIMGKANHIDVEPAIAISISS